MPENISFVSEGVTLRGDLYRAATLPGKPAPIIVMAPGFGGLLVHSIARFAQRFAEHGFNVLAYDNRGFGRSDGLPRQEADPVLQRRASR